MWFSLCGMVSACSNEFEYAKSLTWSTVAVTHPELAFHTQRGSGQSISKKNLSPSLQSAKQGHRIWRQSNEGNCSGHGPFRYGSQVRGQPKTSSHLQLNKIIPENVESSPVVIQDYKRRQGRRSRKEPQMWFLDKKPARNSKETIFLADRTAVAKALWQRQA